LDVFEPELPEINLSWNYGAFIDQKGNLLTFGFDERNLGAASGYVGNSLGQGTEVTYNNIPTEIYTEITSGGQGNRALTINGELIEWGNRVENDSCTPHIIRENVVKFYGTLYLTRDGELYTIPEREAFLSGKSYEDIGELVLTEVSDFAIGCKFFALKNDGSVWSFIINTKAEIYEKPQKILDNVKEIITSSSDVNSTVVFLKNDDTLWSYGNNEYGQCGNGEHGDLDLKTQDCWVSEPYKIAKNVIKAWMTTSTTFYLTKDNQLYASGENYHDLLLTGEDFQMNTADYPQYVTTPVLVMENVKQMECSDNSLFVLKTDNTVWSWGYGSGVFLGINCFDGEISRADDLSVLQTNGEEFYHQPTQIMSDVLRLFTETTGLHFVQKTDSNVWYWGYGLIYVDEGDIWDMKVQVGKSEDGNIIYAYQKHYIIPTPIEFSVETFFQNALDSIASQGIDTSQYQTARYIGD